MSTTELQIQSFEKSMRGDVVRLWQEVFASEPNALTMTRDLWSRRIERAFDESFDPTHLRLAYRQDQLLGFAHGGVWQGEFLRHLAPDTLQESLGYLALIAVAPEFRRQGIGKELVANLHAGFQLSYGEEVRLVVDGRCYNPFYGNFFAPVPPLWGTAEGVSVRQDNTAADAFMRSCGFEEVATAQTMFKKLGFRDGSVESRLRLSSGSLGVDLESPQLEIVQESNYQAVLGSTGGTAFPLENDSVSWVAVSNMNQVGSLIAYPITQERWAVYSLEVALDFRGRGIGRQLLGAALRAISEQGGQEVEALVLPKESPGAARLYQSCGFRELESWNIFG